MDSRLNKIISRVKKVILPIFFTITCIWTLPLPIWPPTSGLDPSWAIGNNVAFLKNLQFGEDIAFTFGPLGFLWNIVPIDYNLWRLALFFYLSTHFLFIGSIFLLFKKLSVKWYHYVMLIPILIFAMPSIEYKLGIIVSILIYVHIISTESNWKDLIGLGFMGLLLSIATLIKFNAFFLSISLILMTFLVCMLAKRNVKYSAYLLISYFIFLISLWLVTRQDLANFIRYLHNRIEISGGYGDAMAIQGPSWQVYVGLISILSLLVLFIYSVKENKRNLLLFLLLNLSILFVAFKHGFVRQDMSHVLGFFQVYLLFFGLTLIITIQEISKTKKISHSIVESVRQFKIGRKRMNNRALNSKRGEIANAKSNYGVFSISLNIFMILILMFSLYFVAPWILNENIMTKSPSYSLAGRFLTNSTLFHETVEYLKEKTRHDYPLDQQAIKYINEKTVDVFPWDIALCWAYNLNWSPRPVFQSYTAYTQHLDNKNGQHFKRNNSPQVILYAYKSIDGRYPLFDEPYTFANILHNYTFVDRSGEFVLLSYNPKENTCGLEEDLGRVKVELGQPLKIPKYDSGYVFGNIELEYCTFGKVMEFIYKSAPVHIRFKFYDSTYSNDFRFIPGVSKNGVFLSQYVDTIDDLASIFSENVTQDISEVIIDVDKPKYYKKYIRVNFVGVPVNVPIHNASNPMPEWQTLKHVKGGIMAIDTVGNTLYSNEGNMVYVDKKMNRSEKIIGWAADDLTKDGNVKTYLVFRSDNGEIVIPTRKRHRLDVANYFGVESYKNSGWTATIQIHEFKDQCYNISLRIVRANGEEYFELWGDKPICVR
jgi:hypothetical protein